MYMLLFILYEISVSISSDIGIRGKSCTARAVAMPATRYIIPMLAKSDAAREVGLLG